ncbi:MAG TPA: sigma-70 family RNA polymerase sigma factor [Phycisphaerae bacterium]|nr:sigma-70 family RNA polymerase sigma factor [Phycisphaerae bacterium]HRY68943.1 sigma-70 family RNA polymerase sigma factor [Phycisphaerae bacterium]HSA25770.1 sigma-70 family RNA polymerase sigma factor [Phycisphaerae bacterium]
MRPHSESDPRSDEDLVIAARAGDSAAFEALYYRYRDWVTRLAHRWTGHPDDALDVLQETFIYLLGKLPGLRLSARMTTFLYPVVKHLAQAARRKRGRFASDEAAMSAAAAVASESGPMARADLLEVLSGLPQAQRETVLMRFVDDMELHEIGEVQAVPTGTVKSRLHHALAALRADPRTRRYFGA